jgi:nitroreductase
MDGRVRQVTLPLTPDQLLTTTRTVRKRLDLSRPVPLALVRECLEMALQAPSGSNQQSWHWMVVTDPGQRAAVGEIYRQQVVRYADSPRFAGRLFADRPERAPVQHRIGESVLWLGEKMRDVPVLVIPCIRTGGPLEAVNQAGLWGSLLPAAWSYCLAARARGLGTAWTSLHLGREAEVAEILGIPDGVHQGALIPTAYYTGEVFRPAPREPLDTVLHVDRW